MNGDAGDLVVVVGALGFIGRLHTQIYRSLGVPTVEVDVADPALTPSRLERLPWSDAVVDVCTPTAVHTETIRWAYGNGARRFLVEKPAADSYPDWRACLLDTPEALIFVAHSYMFSRAFEVMFDACPVVTSMSIAFDKDRAADDWRRRGADANGRLADIMQIEIPHAFSMVLAIQPALQLVSSQYTAFGVRSPGSRGPLACEVRFSHPTLSGVVMTSDLRAPRRRLLVLDGDDGSRVCGYFPLSAASPASSVVHLDPRRRPTTLLDSPDDLLRATLVAGLSALRGGSVPWLASAQFAALVLARIAEARRLAAEEHPADGPTEEVVDAGAVPGR